MILGATAIILYILFAIAIIAKKRAMNIVPRSIRNFIWKIDKKLKQINVCKEIINTADLAQ